MHEALTYWRSHLPEYAAEIIVVLVSVGLYISIRLTENVTNGVVTGFDQSILLMFRNPAQLSDPIGPDWLELVVRDVSALGGLTVLSILVVVVSGFIFLNGNRILALFVMLAITGGSVMNMLLKGLIERPRPDIVPHGTAAALSSFPSGHAMMSAIVYLTLGALLAVSSDTARVKAYFLLWSILLTVLVGVSRIYLGVHWPTDVIAGWIMGSIWALICLFVSGFFLRPGAVASVEQ